MLRFESGSWPCHATLCALWAQDGLHAKYFPVGGGGRLPPRGHITPSVTDARRGLTRWTKSSSHQLSWHMSDQLVKSAYLFSHFFGIYLFVLGLLSTCRVVGSYHLLLVLQHLEPMTRRTLNKQQNVLLGFQAICLVFPYHDHKCLNLCRNKHSNKRETQTLIL